MTPLFDAERVKKAASLGAVDRKNFLIRMGLIATLSYDTQSLRRVLSLAGNENAIHDLEMSILEKIPVLFPGSELWEGVAADQISFLASIAERARFDASEQAEFDEEYMKEKIKFAAPPADPRRSTLCKMAFKALREGRSREKTIEYVKEANDMLDAPMPEPEIPGIVDWCIVKNNKK